MNGERHHVAITFFMSFQPDGTAAGTFTAAGAVSDSGTAIAQPTVTSRDDDTGALTGNLALRGSRGDLNWEYAGTSYPLGAPRTLSHATARLTSGTRDYLGMQCEAKLVTTADFVAAIFAGALQGLLVPGPD